jgi:hypothetical protein
VVAAVGAVEEFAAGVDLHLGGADAFCAGFSGRQSGEGLEMGEGAVRGVIAEGRGV